MSVPYFFRQAPARRRTASSRPGSIALPLIPENQMYYPCGRWQAEQQPQYIQSSTRDRDEPQAYVPRHVRTASMQEADGTQNDQRTLGNASDLCIVSSSGSPRMAFGDVRDFPAHNSQHSSMNQYGQNVPKAMGDKADTTDSRYEGDSDVAQQQQTEPASAAAGQHDTHQNNNVSGGESPMQKQGTQRASITASPSPPRLQGEPGPIAACAANGPPSGGAQGAKPINASQHAFLGGLEYPSYGGSPVQQPQVKAAPSQESLAQYEHFPQIIQPSFYESVNLPLRRGPAALGSLDHGYAVTSGLGDAHVVDLAGTSGTEKPHLYSSQDAYGYNRIGGSGMANMGLQNNANVYHGNYPPAYDSGYYATWPQGESGGSRPYNAAADLCMDGGSYSGDMNVKWDSKQIEELLRIVDLGERQKWKYISEELSAMQQKRIPANACAKKFRELFGRPESSSALKTSLFYIVFDSGWQAVNTERIRAERNDQVMETAEHVDASAKAPLNRGFDQL